MVIWGRPNGLDLYDGTTGTTWGFGINQSDSPEPGVTYSVLTQINYGSGYAGPWEGLGTLIIDPAEKSVTSPPVYQAPPTPQPPVTPPTPAQGSVSNCNDLSNTWTVSDTQMTLQQNGSTVTGTGVWPDTDCLLDEYGNCQVVGYCSVNASITGSQATRGSFSLTATFAPTDNCGYPGSGSATISSCSSSGVTLSTTNGSSTQPTSSQARPQFSQWATIWTGQSSPPGIKLTLRPYGGKNHYAVDGPENRRPDC